MSEYICEWCGKTYDSPGGCSPLPVKHKGKSYPPIKYGDEQIWQEIGETPSGPCHDCGAMPGEYHHCGCDVEECPICHGQFLSCGHGVIDDEEEEDDDA